MVAPAQCDIVQRRTDVTFRIVCIFYSCWLSVETGLIWAFVAPVCVVVVINLCIMIVVLRIVVKSAKTLDASSQHHNTVALVK